LYFRVIAVMPERYIVESGRCALALKQSVKCVRI
jgi:hypothetical protein